MTDPLFTRDGHVLDLALERYLSDDLRTDERALVQHHLDACAGCVARLGAFRADPIALPTLDFLDQAAETAPPSPPLDAPRRPKRPAWWGLGGAVVALAAAASVAVVIQTDAPTDAFQSRGRDLSLEVWLHDGDDVSRVFDGDSVVAGDRVRFRVSTRSAGYVAVVGQDATGATYPGVPQSGAAPYVTPSPTPHTLDGALRFDATAGKERLVAVRCAHPLSTADLEAALHEVAPADPLPTLLDGCTQDSVLLIKVHPEPQ